MGSASGLSIAEDRMGVHRAAVAGEARYHRKVSKSGRKDVAPMGGMAIRGN